MKNTDLINIRIAFQNATPLIFKGVGPLINNKIDNEIINHFNDLMFLRFTTTESIFNEFVINYIYGKSI